MTIKELDQLDFDRKENTIVSTDIFTKTMNKINRWMCSTMSTRGMAKLLMVNPKTILKWEEVGLIFPKIKGKSRYRSFALKDVLRGMTIKYLMSELGFRKFAGVKLLLEITNQGLDEKQVHDTIDNIYIDRFLIRTMNYDVDAIAKMKLHGNSKRYRNNDINNENR